MHKLLQILVAFFASAIIVCTANAAESSQTLHTKRVQTVLQYLHDLQTANVTDILRLFKSNAKVISTSQGEVSAKAFFESFLGQVVSAQVNLVNLQKCNSKPDRYTARFRFSWTMKNGDTGAGEFVDEFIFLPHEAILDEVIMSEYKPA